MTQTLDKCIQLKADQGIVDQATATRIKREYNDARRAARDAFEAGNEVRAREQNRIAMRAKERLHKLHKQQSIKTLFQDAEARGLDLTRVGQSFFTYDKARRITQPSIESESELVRGEMHALASSFFTEARPNVLGQVPKAVSMKNVVRAMMGESVDDPRAKEMAEGLKAVQEYSVREFNRHGGFLPFRQNRGPAQKWDRQKLEALTRKHPTREGARREFIDEIMPRLDREALIDVEDGLPMEDARLERMLGQMFDDIVDGKSMSDSGAFAKMDSMSANRAQPRVLTFKDADNWLAAQEKFGAADSEEHIYDTLISEMEDFSEDIAILRVLGPRPDAAVRQIKQEMAQRGAPQPFFANIDALYDVVSGKINMPERDRAAQAGHLFRSVTNAAALGGAFISALTDVPLAGTAQAFATGRSLPGSIKDQIGRTITLFKPGSQAEQRMAIRLGLTANGLTNRIQDMNRTMIDEMGMAKGVVRLGDAVNQSVMRLSLLERWTTTQRWTFQMEMLSEITRQSRRQWSELTSNLRRTFEARGIDEQDWNAIRADENKIIDPETGERILNPQLVAAPKGRGDFDDPGGPGAPEAARKLKRTLVEEARFAVPVPGVKERATLTFGGRAGTFVGETARTAMMLKSFPVTLTAQQGMRTMEIASKRGVAPAVGYLSSMIAATAATGGLVQQLDLFTSGKKPAPMDTLSFWQDAMLRAGSMGLIGDVMFGSVSKFGLGSFLLGPAFTTMKEGYQFGEAVTESGIQAIRDSDSLTEALGDNNTGREFLDFVDQVNPFGSLWWSQLALDRAVQDNIQRAIDPRAEESFRSQETFTKDKQNTEFFLPPGSLELAP
jgi:hypothetical protein